MVKRTYKRRLLLRIFENIEAGHKPIYYVDMLKAIRWTYEEWNACPLEVIRNCFYHFFKQSGNTCQLQQGLCDEDFLSRLQRDAPENNVQYSRVGLENLLNPDGEDDVEDQITIEQLGCEIVSVSDDAVNNNVCHHESSQQQEEDEDIIPIFERQLQCLAIVKASLERHSVLSKGIRKAFYEFQRELRLKNQLNMKQTTILNHFKAK